jgi:DNA invertase Pin-like site-specific DNA recombinase
MTSVNKNPAIADYVERVTKRSWTFDKLTEDEKEHVLLLLANLKSKAKTARGVACAVRRVYSKYLHSLGYKPIGWRDPETHRWS